MHPYQEDNTKKGKSKNSLKVNLSLYTRSKSLLLPNYLKSRNLVGYFKEQFLTSLYVKKILTFTRVTLWFKFMLFILKHRFAFFHKGVEGFGLVLGIDTGIQGQAFLGAEIVNIVRIAVQHTF